MRRALTIVSLGLAGGLASSAACSVDYGELPAKCSTGECPEGYECINAVCALPGTAVPITVVELGNQRGSDLKLVRLGKDVLVAWESYPYAPIGQAILAKRVTTNGEISETIVLEDSWKADAGAVEPFFDLHAIEESGVLVAIASSPIDADDERPRVRVFRADLEGGSEPVWGGEVHMGSIGYGNVSQPKFRATEAGLELGYFEARVIEGETVGRLAVFELDSNGELASALEDCELAEEDCCPAHDCLTSTRTGSVASTTADALDSSDGTAWIIDETRPSCMRFDEADPSGGVEIALPKLAVPLHVDGEDLVFVQPSERTGEKLAEDPVSGPATLWRQSIEAASTPKKIGELPEIRDNPRIAWVSAGDGVGLLVTPGADLSAPTLKVYSVDELTADTTLLAEIDRRSSLAVGSVRAVVVEQKLFVAWLDIADDRAVIRAAVLPL